MNQPIHTEAVKTDLPSPKPNRRKRLALRFAALVVAVSALGAAYWFTRPPELVWWRSPDIDGTGRHAIVLIPVGWKLEEPVDVGRETDGEWSAGYSLPYVDNRPAFIRRLFPNAPENAKLEVVVSHSRSKKSWHEVTQPEVNDIAGPGQERTIEHRATLREAGIWVGIYYTRTNVPAFNRTYRRICDSLRIE